MTPTTGISAPAWEACVFHYVLRVSAAFEREVVTMSIVNNGYYCSRNAWPRLKHKLTRAHFSDLGLSEKIK